MTEEDTGAGRLNHPFEWKGFASWKYPALKLEVFMPPGLHRATLNAAVVAIKGKRPFEMGGILLGKVVEDGPMEAVVVTDLSPVECQGPIFNVSPRDIIALHAAVNRARLAGGFQPIGYYRSHLRGGLSVSQQDQQFIEQYLNIPTAVFLIIKPDGPAACTSKFFFWRNGQLQSGHHEAETHTAPPVYESAEAMPAAKTLNSQEPYSAAGTFESPAVQEAPSGYRFRDWWMTGLIPATVLLVLILGIIYLRRDGLKLAPRAVSLESTSKPVGLHVERGPTGGLQVSWDSALASAPNLQGATLTVVDGGNRRNFDMDSDQLRAGRLDYFARSDDVQFHLEVYVDANHSLSETLRVLLPGGALTLPAADAADSDLIPSYSPASRRNPAPYRPSRGAIPVSFGTTSAPVHELSSRPLMSDGLMSDGSTTPKVGAPPAAASTAVAAGNLPRLTIISGHAPSSPSQGFTAERTPTPQVINIAAEQPQIAWQLRPPMEAMGNALPAPAPPPAAEPSPAPKSSNRIVTSFTAAHPIRQVVPNTTVLGSNLVKESISVSVEVTINEAGIVRRAHALNASGVDWMLVSQSIAAAKQWRFEPAKRNGQNVPGEFLITFHFRSH